MEERGPVDDTEEKSNQEETGSTLNGAIEEEMKGESAGEESNTEPAVTGRAVQDEEFVVLPLPQDESRKGEGKALSLQAFSLPWFLELMKGHPDVPEDNHSQQDAPGHDVTSPSPPVTAARERSDTILSTVSSMPGPQGQQTMSSMFFVVQTLESIQNSKEGKRKGPLRDSTAKALGNCS
jgi:hypothetical protein